MKKYEVESVYLAGPMRGIKYYNFPAFDEADHVLRRDSLNVINPAVLDRQHGFDPFTLPEDTDWTKVPAGFDLNKAITRDVGGILESDAICLLPGWEKSTGACAEKAVAEWAGKKILFFVDGRISDHEDVLSEALNLTRGDRQTSYGPPDQDFARTAAMWSALLGTEVSARQVAICMIALKLSRETHRPKRDNAVDIAGYARCLDICNRAAAERERRMIKSSDE